MKIPAVLLFGLMLSNIVFAQQTATPLQKNNFQKLTSYVELSAFVGQLDIASDLLKVETIGKSVQGRNLYAMKFSASEFGTDKSKIKVLFFAQQHGNEQSGKEGALLLAQTLLKPENRYLFENIDFALVPQMNPDGSEVNKRRNGNTMDLNRNHMIMTEPETQALHRFFEKYMFEVSMDVHEYSPYGEDWEKYGYRKNADVTLGATTNPNISEAIRDLSNCEILPYVLKYLAERKFSSFEYCPGGPPEMDYIRHSTFDVNDGRQSLGILNTLAFIQEGMNGKDDSIENIQNRAEAQMTGMLGMLNYIYNHKDQVKKLVAEGREKLISSKPGEKISIQSDHFSNGQKLSIPLYSYFSKKDSVVVVNDYRPVVKSVYSVDKPVGYLIPKECIELVEWVGRQTLTSTNFTLEKGQKIEQYFIKSIDSIDFERDIIVNPQTETRKLNVEFDSSKFLYVPINQLKSNMMVLALEPKSMLGLVTYPKYANLLKAGEVFPVLRVVQK